MVGQAETERAVECHKSCRDADAGGCHLDGTHRSSLLGRARGHNGHIPQFPNVLRERNALVPWHVIPFV